MIKEKLINSLKSVKEFGYDGPINDGEHKIRANNSMGGSMPGR
jgi:hypothetical protein